DATGAMRVLRELPGTSHIEGIIPDDFPAIPGCLRLSEAQALIHAYDNLARTPEGHTALAVMAAQGARIVPDAVDGAAPVRNEVGLTARTFARLSALPTHDQAVYHQLVQFAEGPSQRAVLERALAAGHSIDAVRDLAARLYGLDEDTI